MAFNNASNGNYSQYAHGAEQQGENYTQHAQGTEQRVHGYEDSQAMGQNGYRNAGRPSGAGYAQGTEQQAYGHGAMRQDGYQGAGQPAGTGQAMRHDGYQNDGRPTGTAASAAPDSLHKCETLDLSFRSPSNCNNRSSGWLTHSVFSLG